MDAQKKLITGSAEETLTVGSQIFEKFPHSNLILLNGNLGSGKTTFTKGLAQKLSIPEIQVKSPTYTYYNKYVGDKELYHFDLYRLTPHSDIEELMLELEEIIESGAVVVIEWASRIPQIKMPHISIDFIQENLNERILIITQNEPGNN